jgi:major membrane immunogen (membrane-anchored lipoprotein)
MKKTFVRILAFALVCVMLVSALASCGGVPAGEYVFGDTEFTESYTKYTFSGNKVTVEIYVGGKKTDASFEGKYKVKDGEITFTYEDKDGEKITTDPVTYEETEKGIKIGMLEYKKLEK